MKKILFFVALFLFSMTPAQKKFQIIYQNGDYYTAYIADKNGKVIRKLDDSFGLNYRPETLGYFSIFSIKGEDGWTAIDINGKKLFKVLNTEIGTMSPDDIIQKKIRIVDENNKIGFADEKGRIVIKPRFEEVSSFYHGKAIIGEKCKKKSLNDHPQEQGCQHYFIECENNGYINTKGEVIELGKYTFEEIANKIKWKYDY
ncbi:WG repeat-containing protein [Chryseobacterium sp. MYb328]|uniref:WG repeat-containing protein n=1 Tax=Chryseobacterium sp. MYb328 TaxID=2745231 RepID=UPI0030B49A0E